MSRATGSRSLVRRAIAAVLVIESLCALTFFLTALWHEHRIRLRALDDTLAGRSDSLAGAIQDAEDPDDSVMVDPAEFHPPPADVFAVYNQDGRLVGSSARAPRELVLPVRRGLRDVRAGGRLYRVLERDAMRIIDRPGTAVIGLRRPVILIYAVPNRVWHGVLEALRFYLLLGLALLAATTAALVYLLRRFLAPLHELAVEAGGIEAGSLVFRPPAAALATRELAPLARALSEMIERVRLSFEAQHRFVNDAAHELKTAVAVVRSSIQLLAMRPRSPGEYQAGLEEVLRDNERVEALVSHMLTLARVSEPAGPAAAPVDLAEETGRALRQIESIARSRGVLLVRSLSPGVSVHLPPDAARVLVSNLVVNAVQYSPRGAAVRVTVGLRPGTSPTALLEVGDAGCGIAPENLARVFERFFREDPSRARETGGAGLGLSIARQIVESAGGRIELESVRGRGTTVRAWFPAAPGDPLSPPGPPPGPEPDQLDQPDQGSGPELAPELDADP